MGESVLLLTDRWRLRAYDSALKETRAGRSVCFVSALLEGTGAAIEAGMVVISISLSLSSVYASQKTLLSTRVHARIY